MTLIFLTDPLEDLHGPLKPPFLIAKKLREYFDVTTFISPLVKGEVAERLKREGFKVQTLNRRYHFSGSLITFEAWLRKSKFMLKHSNCIVVNFSQCFLTDAHVYYAQGPITRALDDMYSELKLTYRLTYRLARPFLVRRDKSFNRELKRRSRLFIANSGFCASMYEDWDIRVDGVIYPPLDCELFKLTTSRPSEDYVLTYVGKETKYFILKDVADAGVKIKAFGSKTPYVPTYILNHPNIEFLGGVTDEELVDLYSNALYTLFTFTHEPFGYISVESMACGTPVLTYNRQGPSESVVSGSTGWLVDNDEDLIKLALQLWREGYPQNMRSNARKRALVFDVKNIAKEWMKILNHYEH